MKLNTLSSKGSKNKKRLGRGIGSTKGKTCGRGHKGQKSRSGVAIKSFEGGQMPLYRRLPKRGFKSLNKKHLVGLVNLSQIQSFIDNKKLPTSDIISLDLLKKNKLINKKYEKLKLLGTGEIKHKLQVVVNAVSSAAKAKIEKNGGIVNILNHKN